MKIKVKDIAKAAGVSPTAVSLVLNNKPCRLSDTTKEHIRRVAREMKFQNESGISPDALGRVKTIGLVIPDASNYFYQTLAANISQSLFTAGYTVLQCQVGNDLACLHQALESLTCKNVDGIIVIPPVTRSKEEKLLKMLKSLQNSGVPLVLADRAVYSIFCDFITSDNKYGGKIATEHLLKKGHQRVGCIPGNQEVYTARKRLEGYRQALAGSKISCREDYIWYGNFDADTGYQGASHLVKLGVTAIFAGNDAIARGVYQYANAQGIKIPQELSIIGFDNSDICELLTPPLTSIEQNPRQLAEQITEVMLNNIENRNGEEQPRNYYFTPVLAERNSTTDIS